MLGAAILSLDPSSLIRAVDPLRPHGANRIGTNSFTGVELPHIDRATKSFVGLVSPQAGV